VAACESAAAASRAIPALQAQGAQLLHAQARNSFGIASPSVDLQTRASSIDVFALT
jgi:hypothetical protein